MSARPLPTYVTVYHRPDGKPRWQAAAAVRDQIHVSDLDASYGDPEAARAAAQSQYPGRDVFVLSILKEQLP